MIGAMVAAAAVMAQARPAGYLPISRIMRTATRPGPAASVMALPLMLEKIMLTNTVTWPMPPRKRPTSALAIAQSRSLMEAAFMMLAARINIGMATSTYMAVIWPITWPTSRPMSCRVANR